MARRPDGPTRLPAGRGTPNPNPVPVTQGPRPDGPATPGPGAGVGQAGNYTPPPQPISRDNPSYLLLRDLLTSYGLGSLVDWLYDEMVSGRVDNEPQLMQNLRGREEYKQRFRGLEIRRQNPALNAMSEAQYIAWETAAAQMMRNAGLPAGFYDSPDDFADLIGKDVSINELQERLAVATEALYQSPQEVRDQLRSQYGVTEGALVAHFLDPERAKPVIQRQFRSAQVSAEAARQYGQLTVDEAERLVDQGVDVESARNAFGALGQSREITGALAGESPTQAMSRADQLAAVGGDAAAQAQLEQRRRRRQAAFEGGGGFTNSQEGLSVGSNRAGS